ncbi:oligosaccharide flippase family protein [Altererythrobacter sp. BO-6]|uniref:oligosaccharide flippase family protein n=1 Tax=Altererythrobacter sp. BO-6 TaxID=2604537 RepID=UPI0013E0F37D|nr:oligosaccharide flippase family protein [Altererythrobacter sp. BO-6]QIG53202.1 oligosaccharide flippase family protein [Altererythrobacter sp. BO-6]
MKSVVRHQVAKGTALLGGARALSRGFDFITLIILARYLTPTDFGLVAIALSVMQIAEAVMEVPTNVALLQLRTVSRSHLNSAFTIALLRGVAIAAILCAMAMPLAYFFEDERLFALICAISLAPALRGLRSPKDFLLFKQLRFWPDALADVFGKFCALAIAGMLAVQTGSYWAIASATIASPLFYVLATYALVPMRPRLTLRHFAFFWSFLSWNMAAQTMSALNWQADRVLLGKLAAQATVGLYATTRDLATIVFKTMMETIQKPMMSALARSNQQPTRQRQVYGVAIASVLSIGLPIACGQALLAVELIELVLGPQWLEATIVFQAVSLLLIPGLYSHMTLTLLNALGKPKYIFNRNLWDFLLRVPLTIACVVNFGWLGAVLALIVADLFLALLCLHLTRKIIGIGIIEQLLCAGRGLVSVTVMVATVFWLRQIFERGDSELEIIVYLLKIIPLAAITYCTAHWAVWRLSGRPDGLEALVTQTISRVARDKPFIGWLNRHNLADKPRTQELK